MKTRMMRAGVLTAMLAVWLGVRSPLIAQPEIYGWIDIPSDGQEVSRYGFYAAGWVFRCDTGGFPDAIAVAFFNLDTQQWYYPSSWMVNEGVGRADVHDAFAGACPNVGYYQGYHVYPDPPPPGHYDMYLSWATYDGAQWSHAFRVTVTD